MNHVLEFQTTMCHNKKQDHYVQRSRSVKEVRYPSSVGSCPNKLLPAEKEKFKCENKRVSNNNVPQEEARSLRTKIDKPQGSQVS